MTKPLTVLKSVGPKLVPFFKTVAIYFVIYGNGESESLLSCVLKVLPVGSLILFVLLHGMSLSEYYRYSRLILIGLVFSAFGDAFLVWKNSYFNFECGVLMFAIAQINYARAFGFRPFNPYAGSAFVALWCLTYAGISPGLQGVMLYVVPLYLTLIAVMGWRAVARVQFFDDLWTWTKLCSCAGALFFMVSDLLIAVDKFSLEVPYAHQLIMLTYYAAQLGISLSVVDSQVDEVIRIQTVGESDVIGEVKGQLENLSHHMDSVKENLSTKVDCVKENLSSRVDSVKENLSTRVDCVKENLSHKVDSVKEKVDYVKENISTRVDTVKENISHKVDTVKENISHKVDTVKDHVEAFSDHITHRFTAARVRQD